MRRLANRVEKLEATAAPKGRLMVIHLDPGQTAADAMAKAGATDADTCLVVQYVDALPRPRDSVSVEPAPPRKQP